MTPEEKYNGDKKYVLEQIREKELYSLQSPSREHVYLGNYRVIPKGIQYRVNITPYSKLEKHPPSVQISILRQLAEEGVIKILDEENRTGYGAYYWFLLEIIRPKFDELYRQYESSVNHQENKQTETDTTCDNSQNIRPKTLELIAKEIGDLDNGYNLIEFLTNCGVKRELIEYPQTKWRMIYSVLTTLAASPNQEDQKILFKIIEEAVHPLMHNGDIEKTSETQDKISNYLRFDGLCLVNGKIVKATDELIKEIEDRQKERKNRPVDEGLQSLISKFFTPSAQRDITAQRPIPIQIVGGKMEVDGLKEKLEAIATKNQDETITKNKKVIRLPHFQSTPWHDVTIRFLDERNVHIQGGKKTALADYEALGFSDDKSKKPNLAWVFLFGMAKNNGETEKIPSPVPDNIKQIKLQISNLLKKLFKNETEPFYDFSETNTYKLKIKLIPPQTDDNPEEDKFGVKEFLDETMVSKYEETKDENDW